MMKKHIFLLIAISCMHIFMSAQDGKQRFDEFNVFVAEKCKRAADIKKRLDDDRKKNEYYNFLSDRCGKLFSFSKKTYDPKLADAYKRQQSWLGCITSFVLPQQTECVVKGPDVSRIINRELCQKVINENNLSCLAVPKKMICPSREYGVVVVAEKINPTDLQPISKEEIKQFKKFGEKTTFIDWSQSNLYRKPCDKKIYFIDTETMSFNPCNISQSRAISQLKKFNFLYHAVVNAFPDAQREDEDKVENCIPIYKQSRVHGIEVQKIRGQFNDIALTKEGTNWRANRMLIRRDNYSYDSNDL